MELVIAILICALIAAVIVLYQLKDKADKKLIAAHQRCKEEVDAVNARYAHDSQHIQQEYAQRVFALEEEASKIRLHYEDSARHGQEALQEALAKAQSELDSLSKYKDLRDAEAEVATRLKHAIADAETLRAEATAALEAAKQLADAEKHDAQARVREIYNQAEALMVQANVDASKVLAAAEARAIEVGGQAYESLQSKDALERAIRAINNVIDGYGDRYVVPTNSSIDDLAADFGHLAAGESLRIARENTRQMVLRGEAAACDYSERERRETAIRFVIDAFNGRVDSILSRAKHDNHGTLEQEIRDAFALVNLNGAAFRNARIQHIYLDARLAELHWTVAAQNLKRKEREEQRLIQEQIREEEKARRDFERAQQEAAREEELIRKAMEKAQQQASQASEEERLKIEAQLAELQQKLADAETKNQRALSMAQQTRAGNVYIISNVGSFGDDVLKIGMTRRLEPFDRIKELGDASVPFEFDVHAMIRSDDAPKLERELHAQFDEHRLNKVNYRKEFFRVSLQAIRDFVAARQLEATFTLAAEAREYRESVALAKMTPEERERYHISKDEGEGED
jgi:DNA repair exonuclease SbcCD ATPase subunit